MENNGECGILVYFNTIYSISATYAAAFYTSFYNSCITLYSIVAAFSYIFNIAAQKFCVLIPARKKGQNTK